MSLYDYRASQQISAAGPPFYSLIMAAMRQADTANWREWTADYLAGQLPRRILGRAFPSGGQPGPSGPAGRAGGRSLAV